MCVYLHIKFMTLLFKFKLIAFWEQNNGKRFIGLDYKFIVFLTYKLGCGRRGFF